MNESFKKVFHFLYGPLITVVVFFMQHYKSNRERLARLTSREKVSSFLQGVAVIILLIWVVVFILAPEEKRGELTREIKQGFENLKSSANE